MTAMAECIHGLEPAWCSICRTSPHEIRDAEPIGSGFTAQFDGHCPDCNLPVRPGESIRRWSDDSYRHAHHE